MRVLRWLFGLRADNGMYVDQIQILASPEVEPVIPPIVLPAIQPLRAVKIDRVERFRQRLAR